MKSSSTTCKGLPNYPLIIYGAIGGFADKPYICGGLSNAYAYNANCFSLDTTGWTATNTMINNRGYAVNSLSPYPNESYKLLVTGGGNGSNTFKSSEGLSAGGWTLLTPLLPTAGEYFINR